MVVMRLLFFIILSFSLFGQKSKFDTVFCDCEIAREIKLAGNKKVGVTIPPPGPGLKNEISHSKNKSQFVFEREHHSAWYKLLILTNGTLVFDIIPNQLNDDYDFVIFKSGDGNFCDSLKNNKIKPLRSCISRDKEKVKSRTGLSNMAGATYVKEGIGEQYAAAISVSKGDIYYLVLDNVYENGDGHTIQFYFEEMVSIAGVVLDENNLPIEADITLVNQKGDTVVKQRSNNKGGYDFEAPLRRNFNYTLNFFNEKNFSFSKELSVKDTLELKKLITVLPKLKKGSKYPVGTINFIPGETMYLQRSVPTMMNLYKLLQKNEKLKIMLIGHCNGNSMSLSKKTIVEFTVNRAKSVRDFLVKKGISASRIEIDGKGHYEMLFSPVDKISEKQAEMNRRVEVMVLEY